MHGTFILDVLTAAMFHARMFYATGNRLSGLLNGKKKERYEYSSDT
jgi:hypothetical protein